MFMLRFDMRVPDKNPEQIAEIYETALDMARWIEDKAPVVIGTPEHHASEDGYNPAPLILASAMAATTKKAKIMAAATLLPLYEPVRLAEEMIVLDQISRGRVSYVLGIGYRPTEYELFGLDFNQRGNIMDEKLALLRARLKAASDGTAMPRVTPAPFSPGGPVVMLGGGSKVAARRAGRNGMGFVAQNAEPGLKEAYEEACREAGHTSGVCMIPPDGRPNVVFVHPDPEQAWKEIGRYILQDAQPYAAWNREAGMNATSLSHAMTVEDMKAEKGAYQIVDIAGAVALIKRWGALPMHPLCGGLPPKIAWTYLRRVIEDVMPAVSAAAR
jgi:alkanesulfonate monooxygenase SsuD/methylene tetrahydromethanopterin reductase-like flavin-dependent oxidoreductase (luciferase family)